jgi:hypothetical protein
MIKLLIAYSTEAQNYADDKGMSKLKGNKKSLKKGYDWDEITFNTTGERDAFIKGAEAANGWSNEPMWEKVG